MKTDVLLTAVFMLEAGVWPATGIDALDLVPVTVPNDSRWPGRSGMLETRAHF
jgi:hypothetical protein